VLIHGWGMHGGIWGDVVVRLAEQFEVHVVDLPGQVLSAMPRKAHPSVAGKRLGWGVSGNPPPFPSPFREDIPEYHRLRLSEKFSQP
jgi:pimeloyl-ACP methyl ester carboxylesterase